MATPPSAAVSVRDLTKRYGTVEAVRGVSFEVAPGEIFGLLGLNGAGKTTILECLLGLRRPDSGAISVGGVDALAQPTAARRQVGAQLQFAALQDKITPREALGLFARFHADAADPATLLERFHLTAKADATFDTLSGGQRQRLFLALALVNRPQLVVLDEPTAGLDPLSRRAMHQALREIRAEGRAVLLSTHYLEEAAQLCDRVGILHSGRLIAVASPADLVAHAKAGPRLTFRTARPLDAAAIATIAGATTAHPHDGGWRLESRDPNQTIKHLANHLDAAGNELLDLQIHRPSLEDVFLELTGHAWSAASAEGSP